MLQVVLKNLIEFLFRFTQPPHPQRAHGRSSLGAFFSLVILPDTMSSLELVNACLVRLSTINKALCPHAVWNRKGESI